MQSSNVPQTSYASKSIDVSVVQGDITLEHVDVIVNTTNSSFDFTGEIFFFCVRLLVVNLEVFAI